MKIYSSMEEMQAALEAEQAADAEKAAAEELAQQPLLEQIRAQDERFQFDQVLKNQSQSEEALAQIAAFNADVEYQAQLEVVTEGSGL